MGQNPSVLAGSASLVALMDAIESSNRTVTYGNDGVPVVTTPTVKKKSLMKKIFKK